MNSKVVKIEARTFQGKVTGHTVTLENGTSGYLDDKGSDKDIREGEIVEYTSETKQNKKGGTYTLLTLKRLVTAGTVTTPPPAPGVPIPAPVPASLSTDLDRLKYDCLVPVARIIMDGVISGKIENNPKEFKEWFNALTDDIYASIDELKG